MDRDSFFNNLRNDGGGPGDDLRALRQLAFEERTIKRVVSECGIRISGWGRLAIECSDMTGQPKLNFEWFNRAFNFPGTLCGARIPKLHELQLVDLFQPAAKNRLLKAIARNLQRSGIDETQQFAFVFPITRRMFVAHNFSGVIRGSGVRWLLRTRSATLAVEPTVSFCAALGGDWFHPSDPHNT